MQGDGVAKRMNGAITGIAINRVAVMRELNTQLVPPAGLRAEFQPGESFMGCTGAVMQAAPGGHRVRRGSTTSTRRVVSSLRSQSSRVPADDATVPSTTAQ